MKKRLLSILLAALMLVSLLPVTAWAATPLTYDSTADFAAVFSEADVTVTFNDGGAKVVATNSDKQGASLTFFFSSGDKIPAGTYPINNTEFPNTVLASKGIDGGWTDSFAGNKNIQDSFVTPVWFIVGGSVTVSYEGTTMNIVVNGLNSNEKTVTLTITKTVLPTGITTWSDLQKAITEAAEPTTIQLTDDLTAPDGESSITIPTGKDITLDLNGFALDRGLSNKEAVSDGNVIKVQGKLKVIDSSEGKTGKITGGNSSNNFGGGVRVEEYAEFTMDGGSIVGNKVSVNAQGGGLSVAKDAKVTIENAKIINNTASGKNGGGIFVYAESSETAASGGGTVTLTNTEVSGNSAAFGGGIFIKCGSVTVKNCQIKNNTAQSGGGGVEIESAESSFTMNGGAITGNIVEDTHNNLHKGAGVHFNLGTFVVKGTVDITGNKCPKGSAQESNVYLRGTTPQTFNVSEMNTGSKIGVYAEAAEKSTPTSPVTITSDGTQAQAACFSSDFDDYCVRYNSDHFELVKVTVKDNITDWNALKDAIPDDTSPTTIKLAGNITAGETLTISANKDIILDLNGYVLNADGGNFSVIKVEGGNLTIIDSNPTAEHKFKDSDTTTGLWELDETNGTHTITGGVITGGNAEHGGGVYVNSGTFNMYGGSIIGNKAQYGGGVDDNGTFNMYGGKITNNYAEQLGGGINLNGTFNMSGGEITKNETADNKNGGGVYVNSGTFTMDGGKIAGNKTTGYGAGVYVNSNANFTMTGDSVISDNIGGQGAGVYSKGTFTMSGNSEITGNTGTMGGGVSVEGGTFNMNDGTISQNTASYGGDAGGGVYIVSGCFTMKNGAISGNNASAGHGGGVHVCSGASFRLEGGQIENNTAKHWAGGVCNKGTFEMIGGTISKNAANNGGGGGVSSAGTAIITGGTITQNTATTHGGGFYDGGTGGNVTLGGTAKITDNVVDGTITSGVLSGGATDNLYLESDKTITLGTGDGEGGNGVAVPVTGNGGMSVGVTMQTPGAFTTNGTANDTKYFTSDDSTFGVRLSSANGIELAKLYAITTGGITNGTVTTDATENKAFAEDTVTITVTPSSGYQLKADSLKVTYNDGTEKTCQLTQDSTDTTKYTFTMPAYAVTVSAEFERIPTPSSSGGSTPTVTVPVSGNENSVKVSASVSGSTATVKTMTDAELNKVTGGEAVEIDLTGLKKDIDTAKLPTEVVEKIADKDGMSVKLSTATVTFDKAATQEIASQADGSTIQLVVDDIKEVSLNAVQKEAVGKLDTALIIDAYLVSNGVRLCTEGKGGFGGGKASVALPYELKNNRTAANYSVYYVDDAGKLEKLAAKYDAELGAFVFDITHFSNYVVAYDANAMPFADVPAGKYYYDAVKWALENGITEGKKTTLFDPNAPVTRAQVVTFLWRAAGKPVVNYAMNMSDVASGKYYTEAVRWALAEGITKGTDAAHFSPNAICTRGQIVSFLYRYAKATATKTSNPFTDVKAGAYYYDAVLWAVENGITGGKTAMTFVPKEPCTRAQVVTFLYRYMGK